MAYGKGSGNPFENLDPNSLKQLLNSIDPESLSQIVQLFKDSLPEENKAMIQKFIAEMANSKAEGNE